MVGFFNMTDELERRTVAALKTLVGQRVDLSVDAIELYQLLAAVQLATRHPQFTGPARAAAERTARRIGALLCDLSPDIEASIAAGWDPQQDEPF